MEKAGALIVLFFCRKVEAQLRSVRLQDEIEKAAMARKRNFQSNLSLSPNRNAYEMPISSRSVNKSPRRNQRTERLDEFERGKENLTTANKVNDAEIYKYFTNSAHNSVDSQDLSFRSHPEENTMDSHRCHTYPMKSIRNIDTHQRCARCEVVVNHEVCNFCQQNRFMARSQYENCTIHHRQPYLCKKCYNQSICAYCREEICARCNRPTKLSDHLLKPKTDPMAKHSPCRRKLSHRATNLAMLEESYEDSSDDDNDIHTSSRMSSPSKVQPIEKPYSFNIDKSSVFHRSTAGVKPQVTDHPIDKSVHKSSIDDLRRITDEKLSKYAKNYGDMRASRTSRSKMIEMDPYPMPLLAQQSMSRKSIEANSDEFNESDTNSLAFKQLQSRWQIPFTQKNSVVDAKHDRQICVLTQSGGFKKQLQMDKFNFGFDRSDDDNF